ncbi:YitT family protein [Tyzzerella sp. OttesenSCG-928-J15]|nr:YitT family protein [Tyzzerella sp. OttesenSCG-928-J15]
MAAPITDNKLMELIYGVFIPGIGLGIVLETGATTGGTDIIAKIINKYFKIKLSVSLMLSDLFIVIASVFVFGVETGLYSFMGLMLSTYVLDSFLENLQIRKIMVIISDESSSIEEFIRTKVNRGATIHEAIGSYKKDKKRVITTVVNRAQARMLQDYIKEIDPNAFITITNSSSIIGTGFKKFD